MCIGGRVCIEGRVCIGGIVCKLQCGISCIVCIQWRIVAIPPIALITS